MPAGTGPDSSRSRRPATGPDSAVPSRSTRRARRSRRSPRAERSGASGTLTGPHSDSGGTVIRSTSPSSARSPRRLHRISTTALGKFAGLLDSSGELTATGEECLADLSTAPPTIRRVHRRVNLRGNDPRAFAQLMTAVARLVVRGDSTKAADDAALIEHGIGLDEGRRLPIAQGKPWLDGPPGDGLEALQGAFGLGRFTDLVGQSSDEALIDGRDTAKTLVASLLSLAIVLRAIDPPWAAGFGLFDEALGGWTERAEGLSAVLLIVLALSKREELRRGMDELRQPTEEWSSMGLRSWQQLDMLRREVPEIRRILTPARLRRVLQSQTEYDRLQDDLRKVYKQYGRKIDAAVAAHLDLFTPDDVPPNTT